MTKEDFLARFGGHLNEHQREAVCSVDGAILLLAVPGSGKTTVLVTRLGYMVLCCGIRPENILTMTYTVAATREMGARFFRLFGSSYGSAMEIRTINGLSQKIIDYYSEQENRVPFTLMDDEGELSGIVREIYSSYYSDYPSESVIRDIRTAITYCKNSMLSAAEVEAYDIGLKHFADIYQRYNDTLRSARRMDYDDQLLYALSILKTRPNVLEHYQSQFRYLCVDESQDTSKLQHEIIRLLAKKNGNLFMVGDEDQSIYGFRAAYPDALIHFEQDYPGAKTLVMEQNYRSAEPIIEAANRFIARNRFRHPKKMIPTCGDGKPIQLISATKRAAQFSYLIALAEKGDRDFAVLSRNNDSMVPLIDAFERRGILYNCRQFDEVFFSHRVLRDIADIIAFSVDDRNQELFLRIYHKLGCMISRTAAEYACRESSRTGKPLLLELIRCPELGQYSMHAVTSLYEALKALPEDSASDALSRIRYQIGYGEYVERNKLDAGKFLILDLLAKPLQSAVALLDRLEELRKLIQNHVYAPDARVTLSTVHSSKGLEYGSVYLLDIRDGILPGNTAENSKTQEEIRLYEEERRLFYVGMTRAKQELHLFDCADQSSEFLCEVKQLLPAEQFETRDFLSLLQGNHCGKFYHHREYGKGIIIAQGEEGYLLEFSGGVSSLMTVDEMLRHREYRMAANSVPQQPKEPLANSTDFSEGDPVVHVSFGTGVLIRMDLETMTIRFDADGKERTFLKSVVLPNAKLKKQV